VSLTCEREGEERERERSFLRRVISTEAADQSAGGGDVDAEERLWRVAGSARIAGDRALVKSNLSIALESRTRAHDLATAAATAAAAAALSRARARALAGVADGSGIRGVRRDQNAR